MHFFQHFNWLTDILLCTELIVRVMARWSELFSPKRQNSSLSKLVQLFHPRIIVDIFSGILVIKEKSRNFATSGLPTWTLNNDNIPGLMNYMKVIDATKNSAATLEVPVTAQSHISVKTAIFHKDWDHIADILLHQYEQYLLLLLDMVKEKETKTDKVNAFFPSVMYPDLIGPTRLSKNERDLLVESLSDSSVLIPKSHHFFYRGSFQVKIPLTFSACMEAYVNGGEDLCPHWSMENVPRDIFYKLDDFMVDVRFFRQPAGSNLCGECVINNVTQSDLVISMATTASKKKAPPPLILPPLPRKFKLQGRQLLLLV